VAEHVAAALGAGRANDKLVEYENAWRDSSVGKDLYPVRNAKPLLSKFGTFFGTGLGGFDMWCNTRLGFSLFGMQSHAKPHRQLPRLSMLALDGDVGRPMVRRPPAFRH
jgi:electron-transferring-flavoprotein dehydrogenase